MQAWKSSSPEAGTARRRMPHGLVTSPPVASIMDPGIVSVVPLGLPNLPPGMRIRTRTTPPKWRVTAGPMSPADRVAFRSTSGRVRG